MPNNFNEGITYAFLGHVLSLLRGPAKVLVDQDRVLFSEFQTLCKQTFIENQTTLWDDLEVDGLVECMVQIVKQGLLKYGLQHGHHKD